MNTYRTVATVAAACLAGVSLAACSAGLTSASSTASSPASSPAAAQAATGTSAPAAAASAASGAASAASGASAAASGAASAASGVTGAVAGSGTVAVGSSIGNFPIPSGAAGVVNSASGGVIDVVLSGVAPDALDSFYTTALPQDGYTITSNTTGSALGISGAEIQFTGHGYKGDIGDANGTIGITFTPQ
jgi:glucose/arabinose dehydrogenase